MRKAAIAVSICVSAAPLSAYALDWSILTSQSETVELNDNQFLRTPAAPTIGSYSTLTANAEARTPTAKFDLDTSGNYKKYWGPGIDGLSSEFLSYNVHAKYEQDEKVRDDREYVETTWNQTSTALAILNDLGVVVPANGFLDRLSATTGIDRSLTARDFASLSATSTRTSYDPSGAGVPFTDSLIRGLWRHSYSSIVSSNVSSEAEFLRFENATDTRIQIYRNQLGFDATLSPTLSVRGNIGAAYLANQSSLNTSALGGSAVLATTSSDLDWIGDAVLTYRVLKNTTFSLIANQSIGPSVVGSIFKRDSITASVDHTINSVSTLSFSISGNRQISTTTTDFASAAVTYGYHFLKDWNAQFTYRFQHRFASNGGSIIDSITGLPTVSGTGPASSNSLMVSITHSYTIVPEGH